jgi:HSP20 family protein
VLLNLYQRIYIRSVNWIKKGYVMLMLSDPFRQFDRLAQQVLGTVARPAAMPMDAWREGDEFVVALDLPGVDVDSVDVDVEQNVLTVRAERKDTVGEDAELFASERPLGVFSRQLVMGESLDTENVKATYDAGVLTVRIPVAEEAKPRKIEIETKGQQQQISAA